MQAENSSARAENSAQRHTTAARCTVSGIGGEGVHTLSVAITHLVGEHVQDTELMMAGAVLTVLPIIVLFVALQRYYIEGIPSGGLKE